MSEQSKADTLLIVDAQIGLLRGEFDVSQPESVIANASTALDRARSRGANVVYVMHVGDEGGALDPKTPGWQVVPELAPRSGELILEKEASDSFYQTGLEQALRDGDAKTIALAGCMTPFCIDTTARSAVFRRFNVHLLGDCHTGPGVGGLSSAEVVRYHNAVLDDLGSDDAVIVVNDSDQVDYALQPGSRAGRVA